ITTPGGRFARSGICFREGSRRGDIGISLRRGCARSLVRPRSTGLPRPPRFLGTIEIGGEQLSYPNCERVMRGGAAVCCFVVGISVRNGYLFLASRNAGRALGKPPSPILRATSPILISAIENLLDLKFGSTRTVSRRKRQTMVAEQQDGQ